MERTRDLETLSSGWKPVILAFELDPHGPFLLYGVKDNLTGGFDHGEPAKTTWAQRKESNLL